MARRAHNTHWDSGKRGEHHDGTQTRRIALCGDDYFMGTYAVEEAKVTCGKCSSILFQRQIDAWNGNPDNKPLALERVVDPKHWTKGGWGGHRFAYKALYGGEHVGYIVMEGAYSSTHWRVRAIGLDDKKDAEKTDKAGENITDAIIKELDGKKPERFDYEPHEFICKERALLRVPALFAHKKLRTAAQTISDRVEWHLRVARREKEIAADNAAEEAERLATVEGLIEIRGVNSLSHEARTALEYAITLISKKPVDR